MSAWAEFALTLPGYAMIIIPAPPTGAQAIIADSLQSTAMTIMVAQ